MIIIDEFIDVSLVLCGRTLDRHTPVAFVYL